MGTPLPENPVGITCSNCWGPGEPFGNKPTPKIVTVQLFDLQEGDNWNDAVGAEALLPTQMFQVDPPCEYEAISSSIEWHMRFEFDATLVTILDVASESPIFEVDIAPKCTVNGPNDIQLPNFVFSYGGTFKITFSEIFA